MLCLCFTYYKRGPKINYLLGITGEKRGGVVSKDDTLVPFVEEKICLIMCPPDTIEMLCQFSLPMKKDSLFVSFRLSHCDFPNNCASCCVLGYHCKALMSKGAIHWFHNISKYNGEVIEC